jgi:hypothetical protein
MRIAAILGAACLGSAAVAGAQQTEGRTAALSRPPGRVMGVYDARSGEPISGAIVMDLATRRSATTSSTGTLALSFVDTVGALIQVAKLGYVTQSRFASTSPADTTPITIVLQPEAQTLPAAVTKARGSRDPADTVPALERFGFYERRASSGAPKAAFVTEEQLKELRLFKDIDKLTGRSVCYTNLYINGAVVDAPSLHAPMPGSRLRVDVAPPLRDRLDALLKPEDVLAIELYRTSEIPPQYNATRQSRCGLTLVWAK